MKHNFHELKVWAKAMDFVEEIYQLPLTFPKEELYGLTSQTRRAATSVALTSRKVRAEAVTPSSFDFSKWLGVLSTRSSPRSKSLSASSTANNLKYLA